MNKPHEAGNLADPARPLLGHLNAGTTAPLHEVTYLPKADIDGGESQLELVITQPKQAAGCSKYVPALRCLVPYRCQDE